MKFLVKDQNAQGKSLSNYIHLCLSYSMKIYTLTISIDEENDQVEFIREEQYNTEPVTTEDVKMVSEINAEESFESLLEKLKLSIVGYA